MKWKDISLFKFQQIDRKNNEAIPEIDKVLYAVCFIYGYTPEELDNMNKGKPFRKVARMTAEVNNLFQSSVVAKPVDRIGPYSIEYDIAKINFGQYIELCSFLQIDTIQASHYIMASISRHPFTKYKPEAHPVRAGYFLKQPINKIVGCLKLFNENFAGFNKQYSSLFGLDEEQRPEGSDPVVIDRFNKRYGWQYTATQVAEYERISLDAAYRLPVQQALGDLSYLKEKSIFDELQLKRKR